MRGIRIMAALTLLAAAAAFRAEAQVESGDSALFASLRRLECRADSGNPRALYDLANVYESGYGPVMPDSARSLLLYEKSAEAGFAPAQNYLGFRLFNGDRVKRDRRRGLDLIEKAALQGDPKGAANLGWLLVVGEGVERDPEKAVYWLGKAADAGLPVAMMQLAAVLAEGMPPVEPDTLRASILFEEAARRGMPDADLSLSRLMGRRWQGLDASEATRLGLRYFTSGHAPSSAVELFRIASGKGSAKAFALLGEAYALGKGVGYDHEESIRNFHEGAKRGDPSAQFVIAETLDVFPDALDGMEDGRQGTVAPGCGGDGSAAYWYERAAAAGITDAAEATRRLYAPD